MSMPSPFPLNTKRTQRRSPTTRDVFLFGIFPQNGHALLTFFRRWRAGAVLTPSWACLLEVFTLIRYGDPDLLFLRQHVQGKACSRFLTCCRTAQLLVWAMYDVHWQRCAHIFAICMDIHGAACCEGSTQTFSGTSMQRTTEGCSVPAHAAFSRCSPNTHVHKYKDVLFVNDRLRAASVLVVIWVTKVVLCSPDVRDRADDAVPVPNHGEGA